MLATQKLVKPGDQKPTELETQVAQTLHDLEATSDIKAQLKELYITGAREVDLSGGKKAIILFVPVPQLKSFQKIQSRLVRELEKKFSGKHFVVIAQVTLIVFFVCPKLPNNYESVNFSINNNREKYCPSQHVRQELATSKKDQLVVP